MDLGGLNSGISKKINGKAQQGVAAATDLISKAPSWRTFLAVHPAADCIPAASEDEKRALATDLARQGQRQPVILVRVATRPNAPLALLDGATRLDVLAAAGVEVVDVNGKVLIHHRIIQVANDAEAECLSLSLNVHRRHLDAEQKRHLVEKLLKTQPERSNNATAKLAKVDDKTVASVRRELESTSEIPKLKKTVGADGKARRQPAQKKTGSVNSMHDTLQGRCELAARQVHIDESEAARELDKDLAERLRLAEVKIVGLESELEELKAENAALHAKLEAAQGAAAASPEIATASTVTAGDPGPIPDFLQRKPKATGTPDSSTGVTLGDAVSNAFAELTALGCECREVVDGAPAGVDQSPRISTLDETATALENLSEADVSAELAQIKVDQPKHRRLRSRGDRRDAALSLIAACTNTLDAIDGDDPRHQEARDLCNQLEDASLEAEGCAFPGMYG